MASSGGLKAAQTFRGRDAILSGPAGGVVGMAETGKRAGFDKLIGFDMGGTSTDVAHFAGEYERAFETQIAGVRIAVPMLRVHTVAAGGGSIIVFDGTRFRVGPDSAGANPGPKSYRRGGPLTVTDANVMLGKLDARFFPQIFGAGHDQPLDADAVRAAFCRSRARSGRRPRAGRDRRRLHPHCRREHGQRHQEGFGRARLRRDGVCAQLLRLRRRPARLPDRRCARHRDGAGASAVGPAFRLRHGPRASSAPAASVPSKLRSTPPPCASWKILLTSWVVRRPRSCSTRASSTTPSPSRASCTCAMGAPTRRFPCRCRSPASCAAISRRCTASASALSRRRRTSSPPPSRSPRRAADGRAEAARSSFTA